MTDTMQLRKSLQLLIDQAIELHRRGNFTGAGQIYQRVLAIAPGNFTARHLLGVVRHQQGRNIDAVELIGAALKLIPNASDALTNYGFVLRALGRHTEALASFDKALQLNPHGAEAWNNRGIILADLGRFEESLRSYEKAIKVKQDYQEAWNNRGIVLRALDRFDEALESCDKALTIQPRYTEAWTNRGIILSDLGHYEKALESYDKALTVSPNYAEAWNNRGTALLDLRRYEEALKSFDEALIFKVNYAQAWNNRGNALRQLEQPEQALASYANALSIKPDIPATLSNRGAALSDLGRHEEALDSYDKALEIEPDCADALFNRGNTLTYLGQFEEARKAYLQSLALNPSKTNIYASYADLVEFTPDDPQLKKMEAARECILFNETDRFHLDFGLAKAYADLRDYKQSFEYLANGNALKRAQIQYDEAAELAYFDRIIATFTPEILRKKEKLAGGVISDIPVFIIGMIRSGTTLVEQILASHPDVHGAGELKTLKTVAGGLEGANGGTIPYPDFVPNLESYEIDQIGERYLAEVCKLAPGALRITDKMPANYYFVGLIHLAFPNAHIIHTVRDPLDTCISCYSKSFASEQNHTYDLVELGRYHRRYQHLMAHWERALPQGRILNVCYEDVVLDLEGAARRIIAHCGLNWDPRCLSFNTIDRPVRTASAAQVRRPIYQNAVGRARNYEEFLAPLKKALAGG